MYIRQRLSTLSRGLITIHIYGSFNESWMALVVYSVFREFKEFREFREFRVVFHTLSSLNSLNSH